MRPTTMLDLHCVGFRVEEEPGAETVEGTGFVFQKRRGEGATQWREDESAMLWRSFDH
jgi:hypothetical protein